MIKSILVPFDGSAYASKAFKQALEIAANLDSNITLLTVLHKKPKDTTPSKKDIAKMLEEDDEDFSIKIINDLEKEAKAQNVQFSFDIAFDSSIPKGIVRYADQHKFDLVVMGSYGRDRIQEAGSWKCRIWCRSECKVDCDGRKITCVVWLHARGILSKQIS